MCGPLPPDDAIRVVPDGELVHVVDEPTPMVDDPLRLPREELVYDVQQEPAEHDKGQHEGDRAIQVDVSLTSLSP